MLSRTAAAFAGLNANTQFCNITLPLTDMFTKDAARTH